MFGISGFNPVSLLATAALGPFGGIVAQLATQVFSQFGQQLLQNLGDQAGLPQSQIELAQAEFTNRYGDVPGTQQNINDALQAFGNETGATPAEIGDQQRQVQDFINQTIKQASESDDYNEVKASGKAGGWLMAMAKALGSQLDQLGEQMTDMASRITKDTPGLSAEFGVVTQQFSMLMNATTNAIKTVGEAMGKAASKN